MERSLYKKMFSHGPGGIKCPCCRPSGCHSKKEALVMVNRWVRRAAKAEIKKELEAQ